MAHNLGTMADGRATMAFRGSRDDIWHRLGNQHQDGWTVADWASNSGLNFDAVKVPALADMNYIDKPLNHDITRPMGKMRVEGRHFVVRADNGHVLSPGTVTDIYKIVQPAEVLEWFERYCSVDERFQLDVAGALHGGETIWATAVFNGADTVAGERHKARLLMTTTFDGTGSTINRGCFTRVVCNNTLDAAAAESQPTVVRTRHNTAFNAAKVGKELARIVASFAAFKAMGDALAAFHTSEEEVSRLFKLTLDIDPLAKKDDISTNKFNQFSKLSDAYLHGIRNEGLERRSGWAILQAITRYADHDRNVRGGNGTPDAVLQKRFASSVIDAGGGGAKMKATAVNIIDGLMQGALRAAADKARTAALVD